MRVHVALTPAEPTPFALDGSAVIVIDVLRATTTVVAACTAGCLGVIPVADTDAARAVAADFPRDAVVLGGERGGEPIAGFDLGNSPTEYTAERVGGRTIILTTTNGTSAMKRAGLARASAAAALTNVGAAADWAFTQGRHVTVLCAGDDGALSLEDAVCAGLLVQRMAARAPGVKLSDAAVVASRLAEYYRERLGEVRRDSRWARRLHPATTLVVAEAVLAVRDEMAWSLTDVLRRRLPLLLIQPPERSLIKDLGDLLGPIWRRDSFEIINEFEADQRNTLKR